LEKKAKELLKGLEDFDFTQQMSVSSPNPGNTPNQPDQTPSSPPPSTGFIFSF